MSDPASCVPPDPGVSGWWYLGHSINAPSLWWWSSLVRCWRTEASTNCNASEMADYGYRILGPVPNFAEVVEARGQIAQDGREIERLEAELTAANAEIETLESKLQEAKDRAASWNEHAVVLEARIKVANAEVARLTAKFKELDV